MAEHLTDEEQIEALKRWWRENGRQLVLSLVVVLAGYFGWNGWQDHRQQQAEQASVIFQNMLVAAQVSPGEKLSENARAQVTHLAVTLKDQYSGSHYAVQAAMMMARLAVETGDLETAAKELRWAMENSDEPLSLLARLRLARVESARENYDEALSLLDIADVRAMTSSYAEVRGDIYLLRGDSPLAYDAYREALDTLAPNEDSIRPVLQLKLNRAMGGTDVSGDTKEGDA